MGQWDGQSWTYELHDGLGSVRQLADAQGYLVQRYEYSPFGEMLASEGQRTNSLRYTGEQWDSDVGLLYLRARWYDPSVGRFTTRDPFPGFVEFPQTQHPYVYAGNNPINLTDHSGKLFFIPVLIVAAAGGFLGGMIYYTAQSYLNRDPCGRMNWNWGEAAFWGVTGTGLGAILGTGIYGGWWLWATYGPAATTGVAAWPAPWYGRQIINGIEYTIHALGRMVPVGLGGRGVPPSAVENAIRYGATLPGREPGTIVHVYENVMVVTDALSKVVITVIKTGH